MLLLDTQTLIWYLQDSVILGPKTKELISGNHDLSYSSIAILELNTQMILGKIQLPFDFVEQLSALDLHARAFRVQDAQEVASFPQLSKIDPFDQAIVAQARANRARLVTANPAILELNESWILDSRV